MILSRKASRHLRRIQGRHLLGFPFSGYLTLVRRQRELRWHLSLPYLFNEACRNLGRNLYLNLPVETVTDP